MSISAQKVRKLTHVNPYEYGRTCIGIPVHSSVHKSVALGKGVELEEEVTIDEGAVLGENVTVGTGSRIERGSRIGSDVTIGDRTLIHSDVEVAPGITIGSGCEIISGYIDNDVDDGEVVTGTAIPGRE